MKLKNQLLLLISAGVFACSSDPEPADVIYHQNGVALLGYDVVAYHEMNQAIIGNPEYTSEYEGYSYRFLTAGHKESFENNPDQYLPAYGGWCAYAVAKGSIHKAPDPELWQIQNAGFSSSMMTGPLLSPVTSRRNGMKIRKSMLWKQIKIG